MSERKAASLSNMSRRFRLMIIAGGFVLAACTSEGTPSSFVDQDGRVEAQFVSSCEAAQDGDADATEFCQCAFYTAASEFGFERFLEIDEMLRENPTDISFTDRTIFDSIELPCSFSAADVPS